MDEICKKIEFYRSQLPPDGILVAVSKTKPPELINRARLCPHRDFGENKVQELRDKKALLSDDIRWHMIGHLQTNKVKYIAPWIWLIHSVDREKLLDEIEKHGARLKRKIPVLFQLKIAREETKFGLDDAAYENLVRQYADGRYPHVELKGLMGMATNTEDVSVVREEFRRLRKRFEELQNIFPNIRYLSAGMTHDYRIALDEGANIIRIGSGIFGPR